MEILSRIHARKLVEWARDKPEVLVLSADLTSSTEIDLFRDTYPDRFLSMGMAEQNMMSFAGGLAREGFFPFVHTFAVFLYRRALDQISMSIAYPNLPVRMFGFLPGITTPGGATHQAIDDLAVMRSLPNMTILEVGDATEAETIIEAAHSVPGPVYVRMLRGEIPRLFPKGEPFRIDSARVLKRGEDITIFSSGICTEEVQRALKVLEEHDLSAEHLHISTLKPFNDTAVTSAIERSRYGVITIENHTVNGGLGSVVAERIAAEGLNKKLVRLGLQDTYAHGASRPYLMREYGIDAMALINAVEGLTNRKFKIDLQRLEAVQIETINNQVRAEDL